MPPSTGSGSKAVFTVVSLNYLPFARALMASVAGHAPECERFVFLADQPSPGLDLAAEPFRVVLSSELPVPNSPWFHFRYNVLELNTAIKPFAFDYLLGRFDEVIYFDPDVLVLSRLADWFPAAAGDITLTPHLLEPLPNDGLLPDELTILKAGAYNLGFAAVLATSTGRRFVRWWSERLLRHGYIDFENGLFTDQRWIDLASTLFPITVVRDPGWNVAYWNLSQRPVNVQGGTYITGSHTLRFFHFSGFDPHQPRKLSRFQTRFTPAALAGVGALLDRYASELLAGGYDEFRSRPCVYCAFANGTPVLDVCRRYADAFPELEARVPDPFSDAGFAAYIDHWNAAVWTPEQPSRRLTRLACRLYETRPEVTRQFPHIFGEDHIPFLEWLTAGRVHEAFLPPLRRMLHGARAEAALSTHKDQRRELSAALDRLAPAMRRLALSALPVVRPPHDEAALHSWLIEPVAVALARLPRFAALIWEDRADLRQAFPDVPAGNALSYLRWIITDGHPEYALDESLLAPVRAEVGAGMRTAVSPVERARLAAIDYVRSVRRGATMDARGGEIAHQPYGRRRTVAEDGVNIIGDCAEGLPHTVAGSARAAGVPVSLTDTVPRDSPLAGVDNNPQYGVNICVVPPDAARTALATIPQAVFEGGYNIGYWTGDVEPGPNSFDHYDEIWVATPAALDAISRLSPVPVVRVPPADAEPLLRERLLHVRRAMTRRYEVRTHAPK